MPARGLGQGYAYAKCSLGPVGSNAPPMDEPCGLIDTYDVYYGLRIDRSSWSLLSYWYKPDWSARAQDMWPNFSETKNNSSEN